MERSFYPLPLRRESAPRRGEKRIRLLAGISISLALIFLLGTVPLEKKKYSSAYHSSPGRLARQVKQSPPHPKFKIENFSSLTKAFVDLFIEEMLTPDTPVGGWLLQSADGSLRLRKARKVDWEEHHSLLRRLQQGDSLAEEILLEKIQQEAEEQGPHAGYLCLEHILWYGKYRDPDVWKDFEQLYSDLVMNTAMHLRTTCPSDARAFGILQVHINGAGPSPADIQAQLPSFVIAGSPKTAELHLFCGEDGKSYYIGKIGQFPKIEQIYEKDVGLPPEFSIHSYFLQRKIHLRGNRIRYWFFDGVSWIRQELGSREGDLEGFSLANPRHKIVVLDQRGNYTTLELANNKNLSCHGSP
jgi:hypothetical protein